ncbi:MAG: membrane protein insertion efficiency factor YidD [Glaciecola sp.]
MYITQAIKRMLALPLLLIIRIYQICISPFLGQNCRFHPTCSCYAHQAITKHGAIKGGYLSVKRIVKCNPMHPGGIDPVPDENETRPLNKTNIHPN